jgi:hypothetical protein
VSQTGKCEIPTGGESVVEVTGLSIKVTAGSLVDVEVKQGNGAGAVTWGLAS